MTFEEPPEPGLLPDLFSVLFAVGFLILGLLLIRGGSPTSLRRWSGRSRRVRFS
ncbi:hypothetical protein [Methanoculleus chikugoensis]|uniref:hypothetical protein n=1 Tax=Methanoculleus chikugoensis TaxID=118126 RepID=UPI000A9932A4|nr:hypothetical protein [Methanoculleus chikugoensis]